MDVATSQGAAGATRDWKRQEESSPRDLGECDPPVDNFSLKFWLPELGGSKVLLFLAASSVWFIMAAQAPVPQVAQVLDFTLALKDSS